MKNIEERALSLNRILTERLTGAGWNVLSPLNNESMRSAETLVAVEDPSAMGAKLAGQKVVVTEKPQGIRVATNFFNNEADIEGLISALSSQAANG